MNHWGYFIFIDPFRTVQDDSDLHLFLFVFPGQLPVGAVCQISQAQSSSQTLSPWQPLTLNIRALEKESAQWTLSLAPLTLWWKMDCNNNCWPSGHWTVKEQPLGVQPLESLLGHTLWSCQLSGKDNCSQQSITTPLFPSGSKADGYNSSCEYEPSVMIV